MTALIRTIQAVSTLIGYVGAWVGLVAPDAPGQARPLAQAGFADDYLDTLPAYWRDAAQEGSPLRGVLFEQAGMSQSNGTLIAALNAQQHILGVLVVIAQEAVSEEEAETVRILAESLTVALHSIV